MAQGDGLGGDGCGEDTALFDDHLAVGDAVGVGGFLQGEAQDHAGVGDASGQYLRQLPVDVLDGGRWNRQEVEVRVSAHHQVEAAHIFAGLAPALLAGLVGPGAVLIVGAPLAGAQFSGVRPDGGLAVHAGAVGLFVLAVKGVCPVCVGAVVVYDNAHQALFAVRAFRVVGGYFKSNPAAAGNLYGIKGNRAEAVEFFVDYLGDFLRDGGDLESRRVYFR